MGAKIGIIAGSKKSISKQSITGRTVIGNDIMIGTDRMSVTGTIIVNILTVIGRPTGWKDTLSGTIVIITEHKDTLLSIISNITKLKDMLSSIIAKTTDGLTTTAITAIRTIVNITVSIDHPTGRRSSTRDFPSSSRQKTGGKLN
jgi:hypothetical protein